jgi:hypothetical protein
MVISTYQVNNVLRVYGDQLRQGKTSKRMGESPQSTPDRIDISGGAKRKVLVDRIASKIVDRILSDGPHDEVEKQVVKKLQDEYGATLSVSPEEAEGFLFKVIDEKGEALHSLSIEDSSFLTQKLKEITTETIDRNMF